MKKKNAFLFGLITFVTVLLVSFALSAVLGISSFEKTYRESLVSQYSIQGETLKGRIESSLNLGKRLHLLDQQVVDFFNDTMRLASGVSHLYITDANNKILYSTRSVLNQKIIPFSFAAGSDVKPGGGAPHQIQLSFLICGIFVFRFIPRTHFMRGRCSLSLPKSQFLPIFLKSQKKFCDFRSCFFLRPCCFMVCFLSCWANTLARRLV